MLTFIDCDGVLTDSYAHAAVEFACLNGVPNAHYEDIDRWDIFSTWGRADLWTRFHAQMIQPGMCMAMQPIAGAREQVDRLREAGEVICVTAPPKDYPHWQFERSWWLREHFGIRHDEVISTTRKDLLCAEGVLIDDKPANCITFPGRAIMISRPWNIAFGGPVVRAATLQAAVDSLLTGRPQA